MSSEKFPCPSCTACNELNGVETEIFMCDYADKLMIVLTQFKKLGTMLLCQRDNTLGQGEQDDVDTFSVRPLLGEENEGMLVYARHLVEALQKKGLKKPLLLSLAMKEYTPAGLAAFTDFVSSHCEKLTSS